MARARQYPRTRRLQALRAALYVTALSLVGVAGVVVRGSGRDWPAALVVFIVFSGLVVAVASRLLNAISRATAEAAAADRAALPPDDVRLPYGVVAGAEDGELLLPTKVGVSVLAWTGAATCLFGGVAMVLAVDDPTAVVLGVLLAGLGAWIGVLAYWVTGTKIRISREGIESRMRPRVFYRWLEVPELTTNRGLIILKAAGSRTPRVWVRVGALEVSFDDCLALIRRTRGW